MSENFSKYLYQSSAVHGLALLLLILSPYLPFTPYRPFNEKVTWITLPKGTSDTFGTEIKKAKDLPKTTIEEQKRREAAKAKKEASMTYEAKKREEEERIKKALARASQEIKARKSAPPEAAQIPENQPGGFPEGTATEASTTEQTELLLYRQRIKKSVMDEWILPMKYQQAGQGLICDILVRINEKGELVETEWVTKSGDEAYDASAFRAIQRVLPLEPPPDRLKGEALYEGFLFTFKPEERSP